MPHKRSHQKSPFFYTREVRKGVAALHQPVAAAGRCCRFGRAVGGRGRARESLCKHLTKCLWSGTERPVHLPPPGPRLRLNSSKNNVHRHPLPRPHHPRTSDLKPLFLVLLPLHLRHTGSYVWIRQPDWIWPFFLKFLASNYETKAFSCSTFQSCKCRGRF